MPLPSFLDDGPMGPSLDHVVHAFLELEPWQHTILEMEFYRDVGNIEEIVAGPSIGFSGQSYRQRVPHQYTAVHVVDVLMGYGSVHRGDVETLMGGYVQTARIAVPQEAVEIHVEMREIPLPFLIVGIE